MSDTEILDALQELIRTDGIHVVLGAWWSGPGDPDGYACNLGAMEMDGGESPTLREALCEALADYIPEGT